MVSQKGFKEINIQMVSNGAQIQKIKNTAFA